MLVYMSMNPCSYCACVVLNGMFSVEQNVDHNLHVGNVLVGDTADEGHG